jgi:hypothetical protein
MGDPNLAVIIITALMSSSVVAALVTLFSKKVVSPEAKIDLARMGSEFAHQLLMDAKVEREELRLTIKELEGLVQEKNDSIKRLTKVLDEKERVIRKLERTQVVMINKLRLGEPVKLEDITGSGDHEK